ncbi:hypothetical protein [Solwaraspora sp. WMMA2065]|uniref:hypothetical protein n=1 Tax=Solwaraspora sp. WMMA2065 TaxID=3015166 RepID=UPI00259B6F86|nr:hypothetical protein [Solwaraspora sp. WMMA2065]WJK36645.1 hypothetical protein O7610_10040 [Solwaraspora sp. WMMA2065]
MTDQISPVPPQRPPTPQPATPQPPTPTVAVAVAVAPTSATRHLVVGAYLDERFCRAALREVYDQPTRAVAPSYGFDLGTVLGHCRQAGRILTIRDSVIVGVLLLSLCIGGFGILATGMLLGAVQSVVSTIRLVRDSLHRTAVDESRRLSRIVGSAAASLVSIGAFWLFLALLFGSASLLVTSQAFQGEDPVTSLLVVVHIGAVMALCAAFGPTVVANIVRWHEAAQHGPASRPPAPPSDGRIQEILRQQGGNTIVYSGYSPFVGSGKVLGISDLAVRMIRPQQGFDDRSSESQREIDELPFAAEQLVGYVRDRLATLSQADSPEHLLPGLTVVDKVFTAGTETTELAQMTWGPTMVDIIRQPRDARRHYLACQVTSWRGELVTTVYAHFALQGRTLYLEIATCALAPCRDEYRIVDDVSSIGLLPYARAALSGLAESPQVVAMAPVNLARTVVRSLIRRVATSRSALPYGIDRGARVGVRELATFDEVRNDFQNQDVAKYQEIVTRRLVAATLDFLVEQGVDVTEFRQRANVLINSGFYAVGNVQTGNISNSFNPVRK